MDKLIIGRYIPGDSVIHRMDPRSKLIAMFAFVFIIFLAHDIVGYGILGVFALLGVLLSQIKLSYFLKGLRPMIGLILFTVIFQMLFTTGGEVLFQFWILKITTYSLQNAFFIFMCFVFIIFILIL